MKKNSALFLSLESHAVGSNKGVKRNQIKGVERKFLLAMLHFQSDENRSYVFLPL